MSRAGAFEAVILMILVLLCAVLFIIVMQGPDQISGHGNWSVSGGQALKMFMTDDGTLYLFGGENGNTVYAVDMGGNLKWEFEVPGPWMVSKQIYAADDHAIYMYLYAADNQTTSKYDGPAEYRVAVDGGNVANGKRAIMAVSAGGRLLWIKDMPVTTGMVFAESLYSSGGRVYYYLGQFTTVFDAEGRAIYNIPDQVVTVFDAEGRALFNITDISGPPTVDEQGNIYAVKRSVNDFDGSAYYGVIEGYYPNGTLYWQKDLGQTIYDMTGYQFNYLQSESFNSVLPYQDGSLYAWVDGGVIRLSTNGSIIWSKTFPYSGFSPLEAMPVDSQGNLYFLFHTYPRYVNIITPDGKEIHRDVTDHNATLRGYEDGVVYFIDYDFDRPIDQVKKQDLMTVRISAYNLLEDRYLWNRTIAPGASEMTVTGDDVNSFLLGGLSLYYPFFNSSETKTRAVGVDHQRDQISDQQTIAISPKGIVCNWGIRLAPGNDALYLNYYAFNWQYPIQDSKYYYANGLYAIADNGTLLWEKPLSSLVTSMAVNNSTLYYSTRNGGFYVENAAKIGGGLALLAIVYLVARFLLIGSVARARGRLDKNENRNSVMKYIADNPGLTVRDMVRGLDVNLGTIRYHLLILGLNHKIITYKADGKYIRYFTNSKTYSEAQQQAVSLVRREGMGKVLGLLLAKPGVTSRELSLALDAQESAVSRNLRELVQRGIVDKNAKPDGSPAYSINEQQREHIEFALGRVKSRVSQ
ncbi:MAG: winged helix-turn-helix transcriptional regulator [Methanocella sp.]